MSIHIRPITVSDIPAFCHAVGIVAREKRYLAFTDAPELDKSRAFVHLMMDHGFPQLVAVDGTALIGWCDIMGADRATTLHCGTLGMGLLPAYRGKGLGERLIRETLNAAQAYGFTRVQLGVFDENLRAQKLYRKVGFVEEGVRRNAFRIDGRYLDEIMMAKLFS